MDQIILYDIGDGRSKPCEYSIHSDMRLLAKWYTQTATGDVPESRRKFCGGVTWASDQSSYNVYGVKHLRNWYLTYILGISTVALVSGNLL